jgi:hypothetical protein
MAFEPSQPVSVITCDQCRGAGCPACDNLGVYGLLDDQPIGFKLPDFIDLKAREYLKKVFIIKRVILASVILTILIFAYKLLWP